MSVGAALAEDMWAQAKDGSLGRNLAAQLGPEFPLIEVEVQSRGKLPTGSSVKAAVGALRSPSPDKAGSPMGMTWAASTGELEEDDDGAAAVQAAADALAAELNRGPTDEPPLDASMENLEQSINEREGRVQTLRLELDRAKSARRRKVAERRRLKLQATERRLQTELDEELLAMQDLDGSLSLSQSLTIDPSRGPLADRAAAEADGAGDGDEEEEEEEMGAAGGGRV